MLSWRFYGRKYYFDELKSIFERRRWFFLKIAGRRRIGKSALIKFALQSVAPERLLFYIQLPDSDPPGLLSAVTDALDTFNISAEKFSRPKNLVQLSKLISQLCEAGYIVVLDEFQYLNRKGYEEFCSLLQAVVDELLSKTATTTGGLIVLGSVHTEIAALLDDRNAPLYGRVTDAIDLPHLDIASILEIIREHSDINPERLLFLWNLFEGVPKFYRDCYERGVLGSSRQELLQKIFFESSSPLKSEAENWFLRELRGRYDVILKYVARHPGSIHNDLVNSIQNIEGGTTKQIGGYLQGLVERFRLIEKKLPIFAKPESRKNRYYLTDNFLQAWLSALAAPISALAFRPLNQLVAEADQRLYEVEGRALEKLVRQLYEERSRLGIGDFSLTHTVQGWWDRSGTEIDLVACNDEKQTIRFVSCKRSPGKLVADASNLQEHAARFLSAQQKYQGWNIQFVGVAPKLEDEHRAVLKNHGVLGQDLMDLTAELS